MNQKTIFGHRVEDIIKWDQEQQAKQRAEAERRAQKAPEPSKEPVQPSPITQPQSYLILPGQRHGTYEYPDMVVSTVRSYGGQTWQQCQDKLHANGELMLTIRQFVDFLNHLKNGNVYEATGAKMNSAIINAVLDDIVAKRASWRAEWLDARFDVRPNGLNITYHKTDRTLVIEPLQNYLAEDKTPGISLEAWLQNAAVQGLPPQNVRSGDMWYWSPYTGYVARFRADAGRIGLSCRYGPAGSDGALEVRAARVRP